MSSMFGRVSALAQLIRIAAALIVLVGVTPSRAALVDIDLHMTTTAAFGASECGTNICFDVPLSLVPRALNLRLDIDTSSPLTQWGPMTYRNSGDTATITSSFARYAYPGLSTPHTADLLSFFDGLAGVTFFEGTDVSVGFADNDNGSQNSVGSIKIFRQASWSAPEGDGLRIVSYLQMLEIFAVQYLGSAADVTAIDAGAIEAIYANRWRGPEIRLQEEALSYLESDCGSVGCLRTDATGFRYEWREVPRSIPEPASLALIVPMLAALAAFRFGGRRGSA